jgi:hypothetical protein
MTRLLEKAFEEAAKLPENEQNALGQALLDELESEHRWAELFAGSADLLSDLAAEALVEHRAGKTKLLDPDEL